MPQVSQLLVSLLDDIAHLLVLLLPLLGGGVPPAGWRRRVVAALLWHLPPIVHDGLLHRVDPAEVTQPQLPRARVLVAVRELPEARDGDIRRAHEQFCPGEGGQVDQEGILRDGCLEEVVNDSGDYGRCLVDTAGRYSIALGIVPIG